MHILQIKGSFEVFWGLVSPLNNNFCHVIMIGKILFLS